MVVSLILEHQEPTFCGSTPLTNRFLSGVEGHIDVDEYAAGVVLLADLHVVEFAGLPQITGADCGHVHEIQALALTAEFPAHLEIEVQCAVYVFLDEGIFDFEILQFCGESRVTAMIAPVGVQDPELSLVGIPSL